MKSPTHDRHGRARPVTGYGFREADRVGDQSACEQALLEVQRALGE